MDSSGYYFNSYAQAQSGDTPHEEAQSQNAGKAKNNSLSQEFTHRRRSEPQTLRTTNNFRPIRPQQVSFKQLFREECIQFCQNTTIRGVSRIAKARDSRIRYLWLTFVVLLFIGLFICMFLLTKQYLEYNVIHPPRVQRDKESPFPSLTLCNLRPISPKGRAILKENNWKHPREFAINANKYAINMYMQDDNWMPENYQRVTPALSMGGYIESLPKGLSEDLGHQREEFIFHCMSSYQTGSKRVTEPCDSVGSWIRFVHAQYLNCHTFNMKPELRNNTRSMELFVYLDEPMEEIECIDCFTSAVKSQLSGAVIVIHNADTYPDLNQEQINLQPGTLTEIKIKTFLNKQKEPPYGRCSPITPRHIHLYTYNNLSYSEYACRCKTIQEHINRECNCNAVEYPYTNYSLSFCSGLPLYLHKKQCSNPQSNTTQNRQCREELSKLVERSECKSRVTTKYIGDVVPSCNLPCSFYSYESDRSTSSWPTKSWQIAWIKTVLAKPIANKKELLPYRLAGNLSRNHKSEALAILQNTSVLERNLLAILLDRPNFNLHIVEEKEVLSLTSFLSQSGGLFSIWIGLTMISIVEIFELILYVSSCIDRPERVSRKAGYQPRQNLNRENIRYMDTNSPENNLFYDRRMPPPSYLHDQTVSNNADLVPLTMTSPFISPFAGSEPHEPNRLRNVYTSEALF